MGKMFPVAFRFFFLRRFSGVSAYHSEGVYMYISHVMRMADVPTEIRQAEKMSVCAHMSRVTCG